jgi:hypothetical protein
MHRQREHAAPSQITHRARQRLSLDGDFPEAGGPGSGRLRPLMRATCCCILTGS